MTIVDWITWMAVTAALSLLFWRARSEHRQARHWESAAHSAEQDLRDARQELDHCQAEREALERIQWDGVLVLDPHNQVVRLNGVARDLFGPEARPGVSLMMLARSAELDDWVATARVSGGDVDAQVTLNGLPVRIRVQVVSEDRAVIVLREMSEMQRLGRARRDFIANISHELRTPLTSIRLLLESLMKGRPTEDPLPHLEKIAVEVQALEQMSQELLDLAQIESGQAVVRLVPVQIQTLMAHAVTRLQPQAERKQQSLSMQAPDDLEALADFDQISRALGNLVHNAIKFTPEGGQIRLSAQRAESDIVISVCDNGPGISMADQSRVFERFFRADRARLRQSGTGLGLAIAKHVVEAHGGRIWVESEGIAGRGTTFSISVLPNA